MSAVEVQLRRAVGLSKFKHLSPGESYDGSRFYGIRALSGDLTLSAGTSEGDDLPTGTILGQDTMVFGKFTSIAVDGGSAGQALIYLLDE